jgi:DNA-binding response OmpR family regulator
MAAHRVLSVGQCGVDDAAIGSLLRRWFGAEIFPADAAGEALAALRKDSFDLVLVNRVFDQGGSGLELISSLKSDVSLSEVPVMLVSDLPEAQRQAEELGALPGFGKAALGSPEVRGRIAAALTSSAQR